MKIRSGFVSNSSSSSFVVHYSEFDSEITVQKIIHDLYEFEQSHPEDWGENGRTYGYEKGYLIVETNYVFDKIDRIFTSHGVDLDKLNKIWIEG